MSKTTAPLAVESWARKYRPRKFAHLVGQDDAVSLLRGRIKQNKVPGFLLIVGPSGCGKTTTARLFARYINCETGTACGKCESCKHDPDNHPDVSELNAAEERGIDDMRRLIQNSRFRPRYKIRMVILDEAHQLTPQAAQAFLKPLEDTPSTTMYVICTTDPEKLPTAMLTRANVKIQIRQPTVEQLVPRLQQIAEAEGMKVKTALLQGIVHASGGSARDAINQLETAHSFMADDPKADVSKILVKLGAQASPEAASIAAKLVIALHKGARNGIAKTILDIDDPIPTINLALRYNEYAIAAKALKGANHRNVWHTADCKSFLSTFNDMVEKPSMLTASWVQRVLTDCRSQLVSVSMSSRSLLMGILLGPQPGDADE